MGVCFPPPEYCAQIVIDLQERLCRVMPELEECLDTVGRALRAAAVLEVDTILTEQYPKGLGPTVSAVLEAVPSHAEVVHKVSFSCWGEPTFATHVERFSPQALVVCGMETHVCVQQTAVEARQRGFRVVLLTDAVRSRRTRDRDAAIGLMREHGVETTTLEAVLFDWLGHSQHPHFKDISRIVK